MIANPEFIKDKCVKFVGSFQDITDRKKAELAILESEAKFRTIFEIATLGIVQVDPANGQVILVNSYYEIITGYTTDELMKMSFVELTHPEDREKDWELFSKAARGEADYRNEKRYVKKDGTIVWVRLHVAFIRDENGKPVKTVAICEDITERKEAEIRLQDLSDNIPGVVFQYVLHPDGTDELRHVSKGAEKIWGYSAEAVAEDINLVWNQTKAGGDFEAVKQSIKDSIKNKSNWSIRYRTVSPDGVKRILQGLGKPEFLADGTVLYNSLALDITQEARNEELVGLATDLARIGSWEIDVLQDKLYWTDTVYELHDLDPESFEPDLETAMNFYREDYIEVVNKEVTKSMATGEGFDFEAVIITAKNQERWIRAIGNAEMVNGKCERIYGSFQDIHSQKLSEIALQNSLKALEDYKFSLDQSAIIAFTDAKGVITDVNENFCKISQYSKEELIGKTHQLINSNHHPKAFFVDLWKTITSGKVWRGEIKNLAKDGSYYWVDSTIVPFLDEKGKPFQYLAIRFDVTDRKISEQEKNSLQITLENSLNEIYIFDSETLLFSYVNKGALSNLGYSLQEIKALTPLDLKPEFTANDFRQLVAPLLDNEKEKIVFYTNHKRKNGLYPVEVHLQLVTEDNKKFIAIILDITERKKVEEQLSIASEEKNNILESISDAFYAMDKNWNFTYFNKEAENLLKRKSEEVLGKNFWEEFAPTKGTEIEEKYRSVAQTGKMETFEYWYPGDGKWYEINAYPSKGGISVFFKNIDDRRNAAEELQKAYDDKNNILESIGDAFFAVDKNWVVTYWNNQAENLIGRKREDLIGKNLWDLFPDVIDKDFYHQYHLAMETDKIVSFEKHHPTLKKWFEVATYPSEKGLSVYFKDVTLRKEADIRLTQANERFEKVTEATNDAIWDYDVLNNDLFWGKGFYTLFGYNIDEIKPSFDLLETLIHADDRERIIDKVSQYMQDAKMKNWHEEYRFLKADGSFAYVIDRATFLRDDKGDVIRVIGAMTDVTEQKKYEEEIELLNESLEEKVKERTLALQEAIAELETFSYTVSHDLQGPLRSINSFSRLLLSEYKDKLDETGQEFLYFIDSSAKRMSNLIRELLGFAKMGKESVVKKEVDMNTLSKLVLDEVKHSTPDFKAKIIFGELKPANADAVLIRQVLSNLIGNAVKYSAKKEQPVVEIGMCQVKDEEVYFVKDNGAGFDMKYSKKLFGVFQRLHHVEEFDGTGVGLATVHRIITKHGGEVWAEAEKDIGATFYFTLPL